MADIPNALTTVLADLADVIATQHRAAAAAWPTFQLSLDRYRAHLAQRLADRTGEAPEHVVRTMPAADLYLVGACSDGDAAALAAFRDLHVPALRRALAKLALPDATIDEAVQRVLVMIFVGDGGVPQLAGYAGRGTLRSWVRTIGVRTGRRLAGFDHDSARGDDELAELPAAVGDPELELLRARYREEVKRAFAAALAELGERERTVLRQYHLDGLTIDQLAALHQVNRATTARWVAAARKELVARTRDQLVGRFGIAPTEVDSIIRLVRSQLDVSVREISN